MAYYITLNKDGTIASRLISGVSVIPKNAVKLTNDSWIRLSQESDGVWALVDGEIVKLPFPLPTGEELVLSNTSMQNNLLVQASQHMTPLLLSLQLGNATQDEIMAAKLWQEYTRALKLVDVASNEPIWPDQGFLTV